MKKPSFENNNIYHIYNRGVEKRTIFMDESDHFRFIHDLDEFNNIELALPSNLRFKIRNPSKLDINCLEVELLNRYLKSKRPLIELLAFCLMPNHYHLLVRQIESNGIIKFMQKLGTGYTNYFNLKKDRVGPLFQGGFKAVLLENDTHFRHLPHYIHLNPLDLMEPDWRDGKIDNPRNTLKFLDKYRWSSYLDYVGEKNFPKLTKRDFILEIFSGNYKKSLAEIVNNFDFQKIQDIALE